MGVQFLDWQRKNLVEESTECQDGRPLLLARHFDLVVLTDAVDLLKSLPSESIDLVITDPAYESLEKHRAKGTTTRLKESNGSSNAWFDIFHDDRYPEFMTELYRVMKPGSHAYIFCDETTLDVLKPIAREAGFWVWKSLIWVKTVKTPGQLWEMIKDSLQNNMSPKMLRDAILKVDVSEILGRLTRTGMGYHWRASCERILFLEKRSVKQTWPRQSPTGKGIKLNDLAAKDVLYGSPVLGQDAYPTEKPVSVIKQLILNSSQQGDIVLDPFGGSGATGDAARQLYRRFILSDCSNNSISVMKKRFS